MDISLRDAARRVTEQSGDRQLGEAQIAGDAGKGVSKDVRGHAGKFRLGANPIEHSNDTDEMPVADIGGEHVGRMLLDGLAFDALDRRDADHAELLAALGVGWMACSCRLSHARWRLRASIRRKPVSSMSRIAPRPVGCSPVAVSCRITFPKWRTSSALSRRLTFRDAI